MTVLLLAIAVNFEPTRIGLVPLLLAREKPLLQLVAFLVGNLTVSTGFGVLVLFVFHRNPFGTSSSNGGIAQIAIGATALLISAVLALRWLSTRRRSNESLPAAGAPAQTVQPRRVDKFTGAVRKILRKGRSPWLAGLVGVSTGLPSPDYLAVLVIIATSNTSPTQQLAALITFVLTGSLVVLGPLIGFLAAPAKTLAVVDRFGAWTRSRSQAEYAGLLAAVGCLLVVVGWSHL